MLLSHFSRHYYVVHIVNFQPASQRYMAWHSDICQVQWLLQREIKMCVESKKRFSSTSFCSYAQAKSISKKDSPPARVENILSTVSNGKVFEQRCGLIVIKLDHTEILPSFFLAMTIKVAQLLCATNSSSPLIGCFIISSTCSINAKDTGLYLQNTVVPFFIITEIWPLFPLVILFLHPSHPETSSTNLHSGLHVSWDHCPADRLVNGTGKGNNHQQF